MDICTIIAKNYVAHARVLAESFHKHHPDGRISVLVVDDFDGYIDPDREPFELIDIDSIGLDERDRMAASYNVTEFSTAVKPWLLRRLLGRTHCEAITYLDPDVWIHDSLEEIEKITLEKGLVLNPHLTAPLPEDELRPNDQDILIAGAYNLGFISIRTGLESDELLDWWSKRLLRDCVMDPEKGYFVDQRWIDLAPALFPDLGILRDPGYNLAYWNLPRRTLEREGNRYTVDGRPLRFFHFSGFDPLNPNELSRHQNRIEATRSPVLAELCASYAAEVLAHDHEEARNWPYGWDALPVGISLDRYSRSLHRKGVYGSRLNGSIFRKRGARRLVAFLNEPDDSFAAGSGVTRYLAEMYRSRDDLQEAYPNIRGADALQFVDWVSRYADSLGIPPALLTGGDRPSVNGRPPLAHERGVNLAGYLSSELGVGEAARQIRSALSAVGIDTAEIDVPTASSAMPGRLGVLSPEQVRFGVNLICVNADMVPEFTAATDPRFFEDRFTVGMWFWEVAGFPSVWHSSFDPLDELWVATDHVAGALRTEAPIPVETVRLPVTPAPPGNLARSALGMPDGFSFLFAFDHRSVLRRKNPMGLIKAFCRAFEPGSGVSLVIKSMGGERHPEDVAALRKAASAHNDVHVIEHTISVAEKNAMIANCDCYVSLHRSEGFGFTLAEAMYFGKPVIATGYSGNLDFMTEENSYLVPHKMTPVGQDSPPYPPDVEWAEPDLGEAAQLMRHVVENREDAAARGARAAEDIRRTHSPESASKIIQARFEAIAERRSAPPSTTSPIPMDIPDDGSKTPVPLTPSADPNSGMARVRHLLQFEEAPPKPAAGPFRRRAKRLYLRLLRPYSAYQRRVNESMAEGLDDVRSEVARRWAAAEQGHDGQLGELQAALMRNEMRLDQLSADQGELAATIGGTVAEVEDRASRVEGKVIGVEGKVIGVEGKVIGVEGKVIGVEERDRQLQARLDSQIETQAELAATIGASAAEAEERASNLEETIDAAIADVTSRATRNDELLRDTASEVDALAGPLIEAGSQFDVEEHLALGRVMRLKDDLGTAGEDSYRAFEDVFRGSEEEIRDRHQTYLGLLAGFAPVLDLGCGRGELLDLLAEAQMEYTGVDIDPGMVARCREKGHEHVVEADANSYLEGLDEGSFGAVFSAQLIEHLDFGQLEGLLNESLRALRPAGLLVLESVNPHSPVALRAFWLDPTHRNPLYPETMLTLCELSGFASAIAFCPQGSGDYEHDRRTAGDYAVLARAPERKSRD